MPATATASRRSIRTPARAQISLAADRVADSQMRWFSPASMGAAAMHHPLTGCRADTLFGVWLYPADKFEPMLTAAWAIVDDAETFRVHLERAAEADEEDFRPKLSIDQNGVGYLALSGPLTKHPTSLMGLFGGTSLMQFREALADARDAHRRGEMKALFIDADSWGGTAEGTAEAAASIRKTADLMPVHVHAEDKATSGALWLATQGERFTAGRGAVVGGQGAVMMLIDRSENFRRQGLRPLVFATGPEKAIGAPGMPITDEQAEVLQKHIEQVNTPFREDVLRARRLSSEQTAEVTRAGVHVGEDALRVGLVDEICTREEAISKLVSSLTSGGAGNRATQHSAAGSAIMPQLTSINIEPAVAERIRKLAKVDQTADLAAALATALNGAEASTQTIADKDRELEGLRGSVTTITRERDQARTAMPKEHAPEVIKARASAGRARVELLSAKNLINAGMKTTLNNLIGADGAENVRVLSGEEGKTVLDSMLPIFDAAPKLGPEQQQQTDQREQVNDPRVNPPNLAEAGINQGKAYAEQRVKQMQPAGH